MGGGTWNTNAYRTASTHRAATNTPDFKYDSDVKAGRVAPKVHADLDPLLLKNGKRESRDSDEHPNSLPIAVFFDVTGSMGSIPMMLQKKLAALMEVVIEKGGIADPQILMGAIGDATCDQYPLQVGQFESDNKLDDQLRSIILEGNGGGQQCESYALAWYFAANHTVTDAWEKRGKKGYLFTMGDEMSWPVRGAELKKLFGVEEVQDHEVAELLAAALEKWEVYHLRAMDGSYAGDVHVGAFWKKLLGERCIELADSNLVCEVIAGIIHGQESAAGIDRVLDDLSLTGAARAAVGNALVPVLAAGVPAATATGTLPVGHTA